ncbi:uncharacterized protein C8Q71DRAFT_907482 [Rhodofomes roseus]|uniref:Small-subunit processome Utp12 domain-containing protein n=1 Tax=Rhodofomes roseus TaxID=34475 RepID=A0ABQ8KGX2_9APHY|nr:uncharacterized protein C8Q71DRAFT_907482 [Rhodofomes roseus]KAH9836583.1 hypothetical protein C8Q71DRAFT_907482 [Rhodofomes roseus]
MSSAPPKAKKPRTKPPRSRPAATSSISQPAVAKLPKGVQPVYELASKANDPEDSDEDVADEDAAPAGTDELGPDPGPSTKRYNESASLAVRTGTELGQDASMDDVEGRNMDGELDVDLAELSLGQRLTAVSGADGAGRSSESSDEDDSPASGSGAQSTKQRKRDAANGAVPAASLTRTLIQALHSSDARLLETCLAHSEPTLIRNTVRRLPPQLAVPLITACVERLGRGSRGATMKGRGGGASSQRGTAMIKWIKAVLAAHSGHLMTMPDLVARLSGLHATLSMRLTLHESLLALNGRLDMVISQIEMRSSAGPTELPGPKRAGKHRRRRPAKKYVEGESEAEEEQPDEHMDVEVESGDDGGSVEDIELGGDDEDEDEEDEESDEDEGEDEDEEDEDDEDDEEDDGPKLNGFIDDEAEEEYSEDESDNESE